jgi:hypothetical protein
MMAKVRRDAAAVGAAGEIRSLCTALKMAFLHWNGGSRTPRDRDAQAAAIRPAAGMRSRIWGGADPWARLLGGGRIHALASAP